MSLKICIIFEGVEVDHHKLKEGAVVSQSAYRARFAESKSLHCLKHVHHTLYHALINGGHQSTEHTTATHCITV